MNKRPRGRPSTETGARDAILEVARRRFLAEGYDRVTLRSVAAEAGTDVALVSYHFGSKKGLFGAALALTASPAQVLADALDGPLRAAPERLIEAVLRVWDGAGTGPQLHRAAETVLRDPDVTRLFREVLEREMVGVLAERLGGADARHRAVTALSVVAGLIVARYLVRVEPLASMRHDELVARYAPLVRTALAGPRKTTRPVGVGPE